MNRVFKYVLLVLFLITLYWLVSYFMSKSGGSTVITEFTEAKRLTITKKTVATGSIMPRREILIKPQLSGIIEQLFVEAGQIVKKGQKLARIRLVPSPTNLNNAISNYELAKIRYEDAVRENERQQKVYGKKLDVEDARLAYENALIEKNRQESLLKDGIISQKDFDTAVLALAQAKANLERAVLESDNNKSKTISEVELRRQDMLAAKGNLDLMKDGVSKNNKTVSNLITATVSGMILEAPVEEGGSVVERSNFNEGSTIAAIADMNSLIFEGNVDEAEVGKLKEGMPLILAIGAIPGEEFEAMLEYVAPKGVFEDGAVKFPIRAAVKQKENYFLRAGYSANGNIILEQKDSVMAISERDLLFEGDNSFVEIKTGETSVEKREVKTGISDGIHIEILEGLKEGEKIKAQKGYK